ncbi:MAG: hypothetical protein L0956_01030, partial [Candidatus Mariimomonas ferrooxydans]
NSRWDFLDRITEVKTKKYTRYVTERKIIKNLVNPVNPVKKWKFLFFLYSHCLFCLFQPKEP